MSVRQLTASDLDGIFQEDIAPVVFPGDPAGDPTLVVVTGSPGAGASRATGRTLANAAASIAVISNEQLEGFHPDVLDVATPSDENAVREAAIAWSAAAMKRARGDRRSLLIEGEGLSAGAVAGTAKLFARDGYRTQTVIVASGRAQTMLAVISAYARALRDGTTSVPVRVSAHDSDRLIVRAIVNEIASTRAMDRLTILDHRGDVVFDRSQDGQEDPFRDAAVQLQTAEEARLTPLESAEWMSELRRMTEFELASQRHHPALVDGLIELHEIALNDVVPKLAVPRGSAMVARQEREYAGRLVQLRRMQTPSGAREDLAASVVVPPTVGRDGIGR